MYSIQFSSVAQSCLTLCDTVDRSTPGPLSITNSWSTPKPMSIESVMPSSHPILCHPLRFPPSIFSSIRVFSNESALHIRWPKCWSFSFSICPSNEHPGLIGFNIKKLRTRQGCSLRTQTLDRAIKDEKSGCVRQEKIKLYSHTCT